MITDAIINAWVAFCGFMLGLFPTFSQSVTNAGLMGMLEPVVNAASNLGAWIPWLLVATWAPVVFAFYTAAFIARIIKSFLPTISG